MALQGYPLDYILPTDTFKEWADKCNVVIDALINTSFLTEDQPYLRADKPADITGSPWKWTSTSDVTFNGNFTINNLNKTTSISGTGDLSITKKTNFTNIVTLDQTTGNVPQLTFKKGAFSNTLGYGASTNADGPLVSSAHFETPKLIVSGDEIQINTVNYTWPNSLDPIDDNNPNRHFLAVQWLNQPESGVVGVVEIENRNVIIDQAITASVAAINDANFVLPVELIPVGTRVSVDYEVISQYFPEKTGAAGGWPEDITGTHPTFKESSKYPTWLVCDGSLVDYDVNEIPDGDRFEELVKLLDPSQTGNTGYAYLPDAFDETKNLGLTTDNTTTNWQVIGDSDESTEGGALGAGEWDVNLNFLSDGAGSGWSYEQPLDNESFVLYEKYVAGGIGWDYIDNDVTPSSGLFWRTVTLDLNAAYTAAGGTLPDNVVGITIDNVGENGLGEGQAQPKLAHILPGDWTPTVDQWLDNPSSAPGPGYPDGGQFEAEVENALCSFTSRAANAVIPIGPDGILKLNWGWYDGYKNYDPQPIKIQLNVKGFWVEGGTSGSTYVPVASLNQKFHVPKGKYLHFKTDNRIESPLSWEASYAITINSTTPSQGSEDWELWQSYTGIPIPGDYSGTARRAGDGAYLIKAEPDSASNFFVKGGQGISITPAGPQGGSYANAFDIYGTPDISLDVDPDQFTFSGNTLDINYSVGNTDEWNSDHNSKIVKRSQDGQIRANTPVDIFDVATKDYVDNNTAAGGTFKINSADSFSATSTPEHENAYQIAWAAPLRTSGTTPWDSLSIIDKNGWVRYFGFAYKGDSGWSGYKLFTGNNRLLGNSNDIGGLVQGQKIAQPKSLLSSNVTTKPWGLYGGIAKTILSYKHMQMLIDHDDICYVLGNNDYGIIGKANIGGTSTSRKGAELNFKNDSYNNLTGWMPGIVPNNWESDYITVDWFAARPTVQDNALGRLHIFIKTKDNDDDGIRGRIISVGENSGGELANLTQTDTTANTGPQIWGPKGSTNTTVACGPWSTLWRHYATDNSSEDAQRESFHYHTDVNQYPNEWYIKKIFAFEECTFVLVQRNDDTTGVNAELWSSGRKDNGVHGAGNLNHTNISEVPLRVHTNEKVDIPGVTNSSSVTVSSGAARRVKTTVPHNLEDWSILTSDDGASYICRLGGFPDTADELRTGIGSNPETQFRCYRGDSNSKGAEQLAYIGHTTETVKEWDTAAKITQLKTLKVHKPLKGIKDLANFGHPGPDYNTIVGLTVDHDLYGWGRNAKGGTGLSSNSAESIYFATQSYAYTGSNDKPIAVISGGRGGADRLEEYSEHTCNFHIRENESGQRSLWGCGDPKNGKLNYNNPNSETDIQREWKQLSANDESVEKVFVDGYARGIWYVGVPDDTSQPNRLMAAGINGRQGLLGFGGNGDFLLTAEYIEVPFPEDPMNIVQLYSQDLSVVVLCKNDPTDSNGRIYICGAVRGGTFSTAATSDSRREAFPYFERIDNNLTN